MDCDPKYFRVILNYLRHGEVLIDPTLDRKGVLILARYYQLTDLTNYLESSMYSLEPNQRGTGEKWELVFEEDFREPSLNSDKWITNTTLLDASIYPLVYGRLGLLNRVFVESTLPS